MQAETSPAPMPAKRQSLYTCIRYASRLMKIRTDIRKHRTLPNNCCDFYHSKERYIAEDEANEKIPISPDATNMSSPTCPAYQYETQPVLPSKLTFHTVTEEFDEKEAFKSIVSEKEALQEQDDDCTAIDTEEEKDTEYCFKDEYELTLQKLSGIALDCPRNNTFTAVRIKMSPNALAAANAARQKRQKMRINH